MAQWVKVLITKPDNLIPGSNMEEGVNQLFIAVLLPLHMCCITTHSYTSVHTHAYTAHTLH